ncbi:FadR/GntR family transcriptional regulator [Bacillus sp. REN16]|uniref:FadR/GntR family transcriptional regulator n=1 Tax=Bacillus sp. REN16 TaxID=2887296 RepID=UPI001E51EB83|nr:FadR/GntR family transcriptional regulator [Bacillus sp. REN16]MCC3355871.1 FadR family transcriptional regulator [Bacillus sp. REN16]
MEYKHIKPKKIYEEVEEALHTMILTGKLKPGDRLESVQQLAENFQVSRSAIREALSALKAKGFIDIKQGEGTFVKEFEASRFFIPLSSAILMNKKDVVHLLEVRKIIETGVAVSAAKNRNEQDLKAMAEALDEMKGIHGDGELGEKADFKFHLALSAASHNPLLSSILDQISGLMIETMKETRRIWLFSKQTAIEKLYREHVQIYQAIEERNQEKSRLAMQMHLENVENILSKYFQETNEE